MKKYKFLLKPAFYIFNIFFASWLVIKIEKLRPSDMGKFRSLFENETKATTKDPSINYGKQYLKKLCLDYKNGVIDGNTLDAKLEKYIEALQKKK